LVLAKIKLIDEPQMFGLFAQQFFRLGYLLGAIDLLHDVAPP
jgi:hypothetical protein